jgi:hypothetical protein
MGSVFNFFFGVILFITLCYCVLVGTLLLLWIILGIDSVSKTLESSPDLFSILPISKKVFDHLMGVLLLFCLIYTVFSLMEKLR